MKKIISYIKLIICKECYYVLEEVGYLVYEGVDFINKLQVFGVGGFFFDQDYGEVGRDEGYGEYDINRDYYINSILVFEKKYLQVYFFDFLNMFISKRYCECKLLII